MINGKRKEEKVEKRIGLLLLLLALFLPLFPGCDSALGDPDKGSSGDNDPATLTDGAAIARAIDSWSGVWYSRFGGRKLDGYRIGKWKDRHALLPQEKVEQLFPGLDLDAPRFVNYSGASYDAANDFPPGSDYPAGLDDAYFIFYDDTVYEQSSDDGGNGGWGDTHYRYLGIVKALNTFSGSAGAVIIQYLGGCFPNWDEDFIGPPPYCYFGLYYRINDSDTIQMANAVDLDSLYNGKKYYTETATLDAAIATSNPENERKFISWNVVIAQKRE
jgi:hypothetical protein